MTRCCCYWCGSPLIWCSDFSFEDYDIDGDGVVAHLACSNEDCGSTAQFYTKINEE